MCLCLSEITESVIKNAERSYEMVNYVAIPQTYSGVKKIGIQILLSVNIKHKNGNTKCKEVNQTLITTHCPFCGEKYE